MKKIRVSLLSSFAWGAALLTLIVPWSFGFKFNQFVNGIESSKQLHLSGWLNDGAESMGYYSKNASNFKEFFGWSHLSTAMMEITICLFVFALLLGVLSTIAFVLSKKDSSLTKFFDLANIVLGGIILLLVILLTASLASFSNDYSKIVNTEFLKIKLKMSGGGIFSIIIYWAMAIWAIIWSTLAFIKSRNN